MSVQEGNKGMLPSSVIDLNTQQRNQSRKRLNPGINYTITSELKEQVVGICYKKQEYEIKCHLMCKKTVRHEQNICYLHLPLILKVLHFRTKCVPAY